VFIIVMENLGYGPAIALPYVATLAARYAAATAYDSVAHPSLPNYLALTSGETWVHSDCFFCYQNAPNIGAQLSAAGIPWGAYMQGLPADCSLGPFDLATNYAGKHDPFRYYEDVRGSPALCAHIQPLRVLENLLPPATGSTAGAAPAARVPRFVWITPNLCNDGHSCAPTTADAWLQSFVPRILRSPAWQQGGVLFLTWDEGNGADTSACCGLPPGTGGGHILTLVMAPGLPAGLRVAVPYDHYSLLATMEDGLGLPLLGHAQSTPPMAAFWAGGK
jgi:phospholipase C